MSLQIHAGNRAVTGLLPNAPVVQRCGGQPCDCDPAELRALQRTADAAAGEPKVEAAEDPGIPSEPTPGQWYQVSTGDTLFGITGRAYRVSPGPTRLAYARMVNDHPDNQGFHTANISESERKLFGGPRISLLPRFAPTPGATPTFAVIYLPPAGDTPVPSAGVIEAIEAPASITPPTRVQVKARVRDADPGVARVLWRVLAAADMTPTPAARVKSEGGGLVAVLEADADADQVPVLELQASTDPAHLDRPEVASSLERREVRVNASGSDGPATDDCDETQEGTIGKAHQRAKGFLAAAASATADRLAVVPDDVAEALDHWFNIDRDDRFTAFEGARDYLKVQKAIGTMQAGSANASYECGSILCDVSHPCAIAALFDIVLCDGWFGVGEDRQAAIMVHEWSHKWGSGVSRAIETYWSDDPEWRDMSSSRRVTMPDAYEGFAMEMATGRRERPWCE